MMSHLLLPRNPPHRIIIHQEVSAYGSRVRRTTCAHRVVAFLPESKAYNEWFTFSTQRRMSRGAPAHRGRDTFVCFVGQIC